MTAARSPFRVELSALAVIFVLGALLYSNTMHAEFHLDDYREIVDNHLIHQFPDLKSVWAASQTRFIPYLTLAVNYWIHGKSVEGYHAVNLIFHLLNVYLVWTLLRLLWNCRQFSLQNLTGPEAPLWLLFGCSLIFMVHPLQTQAVIYVIQRSSLIVSFFYLASLTAYVRFRLTNSRMFYGISLLTGISAMFCKQNAVTLPLAVCFVESVFFSNGQNLKTVLKRSLPFFILLLPLLFLYTARRWAEPGTYETHPPGFEVLSRYDYFLTQINVIRTYWRLLVWPAGQNIDHDYPAAPGFLDFGLIASFALHALIFLFAIRFRKRYPFAAFGALWFYLTLAVESSVIPLMDLMFEHRLYLPMAGICLIIFEFLRHIPWRFVRPALLIAIIAVLCGLTYSRNQIWRDGISLWEDAVRKSPGKLRAYYNLAFQYGAKGEYGKAVRMAKKAVALHPEDSRAYLTLAVTAAHLGDTDEEIAAYEKAFSLGVADNPMKYINNLGLAYDRKQNFSKAVKMFEKAIEVNPGYPGSYNNLGVVYSRMGQFDQALRSFEKAINLHPRFAEPYHNQGQTLLQQGEVDRAIELCQKAIQLKPNYPDAYNTLGVAYGMKGDWARMIEYCEKAIFYNPQYVQAHMNLVEATHRTGDTDKFVQYSKKLKELNPDFEKLSGKAISA